MMAPADEHGVLEIGLPDVSPVNDVMPVDDPMRAAGKTTAAIPNAQRAPERGGNRPRLPADVERLAGRIIQNRNDAGIAEQPPTGFRGEARAILQRSRE